MNTDCVLSVVYPKKIVEELEDTYKKYSSMKVIELRREVPSYVKRKANMIVWKINSNLGRQKRSFWAGERRTEPPRNSIECEEIVKSSLKKTIDPNVYELLELNKLCYIPQISRTHLNKGLYYTQRAIIIEVMKKTIGVMNLDVVAHINSFLTDYKGEVGNIHPLLCDIEYKPKQKKRVVVKIPKRKVKVCYLP